MQDLMTFVSELFTDSSLLIYGVSIIGIIIFAVMIVRKFITMEDQSHQDTLKRKQAEITDQQRKKSDKLAERRKQIEDKKERVREIT